MFDKIIGFIGAGNMGSAMIGGILNASLVTTGQVIASAHSKETLDTIHSRFSIETTLSNETVAERSDILFLAVKPNKFDEVIPQIAPHVKSSCIIVSIAAGKTSAAIEKAFGKEIKLVRAMPNTPALVGEAMSALCVNAHFRLPPAPVSHRRSMQWHPLCRNRSLSIPKASHNPPEALHHTPPSR